MKTRPATAALLLLALPLATLGFDLQGHRGARGLAPENTLAGFEAALAVGVTTLELDTAVTRDGKVVISHDAKLNPNLTRDAQGRWLDAVGPAIFSMTLAELQRYDVGRLAPDTKYAQTYPLQQACDGERIPTLAALFERVAAVGATQVRFNTETKLDPNEPDSTPDPAAFAQAVLNVVREHRLESRVTLQSFDWRSLLEVQRTAPAIATATVPCAQAPHSSRNTR